MHRHPYLPRGGALYLRSVLFVFIPMMDFEKIDTWGGGTVVRVRPDPVRCQFAAKWFPFAAPEYARNYSRRFRRHGRGGTGCRNFRKM